MKLEVLQKIIKKKQNKSEFAIVTNLSTGESEIFEKNKKKLNLQSLQILKMVKVVFLKKTKL